MNEPDVVLTDYAVALECAVLTGLLFRGVPARRDLRRLFAIFFVSAGIGALSGGTVHGYFPNERSAAGAALWRIALLALGVTTFAAWSIGGRLLFAGAAARRIPIAAGAAFAAYAGVILAVSHRFWIAIVNYAPSIVFLGAALIAAYRRKPERSTLAGLIGLALMIAAAVLQQLRIGIHPDYFNHNALFHLIQMTAFALFFTAGSRFVGASAAPGR